MPELLRLSTMSRRVCISTEVHTDSNDVRLLMEGESAKLFAEYLEGKSEAATLLFDRYVTRLVALAKSRLSPLLQARIDPEDVVQSAYRSFFCKAKERNISLNRSGDLWRLLAAFTINKAKARIEKELAQQRNPHREENPTALLNAIQNEPSPEEAAILVEQLTLFMEGMKPRDRRILELRLQGETIDSIAVELGRSESDPAAAPKPLSAATVRRVLRDSKAALERVLYAETD
ncbi:MAG TPA: ECF-type sigma factor [Planctomycetaceae bacterium]|nr:ECF-type sigma factor [Planctomycetaceae bacterium]